MRTVPYDGTSYWTGPLKSDPTIVNSGAIYVTPGAGEYKYHETIRKGGQIIVEMEARGCVRVGNTPPMVATQPQQEESAGEEQKAKWERRLALEHQRSADDAYLKCLHDNTGTFAIVSNETAETVVKAAIGACFEARQALTDASQKAGAGLDDQWFAGLHQALSNQLIAYVLEMRAAAALERAKNAPETKPDTVVKWK